MYQVNNFEEFRRELERLFGYPMGAFDPLSPFFRDAERINRALGEGFTLMQASLASSSWTAYARLGRDKE